MNILDKYIDQLLEKSTPQAPIWNIEKIKSGKPSTWNYIDGCMIKAILDLYAIKGDKKFLEFADSFIDYFVQEDGSIHSYDPLEYNIDNVNAGKTLSNFTSSQVKKSIVRLSKLFILRLNSSLELRKVTSGINLSTHIRFGLTVFTWVSHSMFSTKLNLITVKTSWIVSTSL